MLLLEKIGETPGHICSLKFFGAIYHHLPSSKKNGILARWYLNFPMVHNMVFFPNFTSFFISALWY